MSSCFTFELVTKNETPASELRGTFFTSWLRQSINSAEPSDAITFMNRENCFENKKSCKLKKIFMIDTKYVFIPTRIGP